MIRINQIKIDITNEKNENQIIRKMIAKKLRIKNDEFEYKIRKKSIDARKNELKYIYCVDCLKP